MRTMSDQQNEVRERLDAVMRAFPELAAVPAEWSLRWADAILADFIVIRRSADPSEVVLDEVVAENEALRKRLGEAERLLASLHAREGSTIDLFLRGATNDEHTERSET